ncbi:CTP synthase [Candidatus Campbellbacteria bacterium CG10_big_fil_rev_8_21_14_0_10_35_52]|uniref:CTP synthase n=1 Tax=Candidatus Campbellbacteria bacterium CG10_big_fil_rev_8_21_14_0_10_35_52 TaxID=1974527 RepID=A0A2M6WV27_9BACT|nr:MAG: CTP synthase [Candidatus Campbellbacteria bacterium CG10_big_fil_rev_8_21_14_0_10_35_52]
MNRKNHKYIFIIGGVMSGVGKGIAASSIGNILQARGFSINLIKIDPYLNVDAGTMNPTEHGEAFVLKDGLECDQDMGNYERFLDIDLTKEDYITSGMVYKSVIERERNLGYKGKCVEAIPHIRDEIIYRINKAAERNGSDISIIEIGGTIGDYQNIMFIEAARVLNVKKPNDVLFIMMSYLPIPKKLGEMKSKPTQNAVRLLNSYGVQPDIIIARSERLLDKKRKEKIAISCSVRTEYVISAPDIESIYDVPINFEKDNLGNIILKLLGYGKARKNTNLKKWRNFTSKSGKILAGKREVNIAIVGKYFDTGDFILSDAYISIIEALKFSSYEFGVKPLLHRLDSKEFDINKNKLKSLSKYDGILIPGGFGKDGVEGKLKVIQWARENKKPYFGICYGMQLAIIEYSRNVLGMKDANTSEINPKTKDAVIDIMPDQKKKLKENNYGGTMRLGSYEARLKEGTIARKAYGKNIIKERHRHRYEVNPEYIEKLSSGGMVFSGVSSDGKLMEIVELPPNKHPFFLSTQFHPEFQARPLCPHPLFTAFIKVCVKTIKSP